MEPAQYRMMQLQDFVNAMQVCLNFFCKQRFLSIEYHSIDRADYLLVDFSISEHTLATPRDDWAELPSPLHNLPLPLCCMLMKNLLSWRPLAWGDVHDVISDNSLSGNLAPGSACLSLRIRESDWHQPSVFGGWEGQLKIYSMCRGPRVSLAETER